MAQIDIVRTGASVQFQPTITIVVKNDTVFWRNLDPLANHQVAIAGGQTLTSEIARFVVGQPAEVSEEVVIDVPLDYACALHATEQGSVIIAAGAVS